MRTLYVAIPDDVLSRLVELARQEYREPKAQAAALIVDGLRRAESERRSTEAAGTAHRSEGQP